MKICCLFILIFLSVISAYGQTQSIQVSPGWNLLSMPLATTDNLKSVLFPSAVSDAFIYQDGYRVKDTIQNGPGFWLKFDTAETIGINGVAIYDDTIEVRAGWNMIGSLTMPFYTDSILTEPEGIIVSEFFNYPSSSSYAKADIIFPGFGYWVKVNTDGKLIFSSEGKPCSGEPTVEYAGKTYNTVQIGDQCWLKENLDVGTRIDGSQNQTDNSAIEKYCYNNDTNNCNIYGGLYQWSEAMQYSTTPGARGICPPGWHIPTYAAFQTLSGTVGGDGNALKKIGQGQGAGAGTNTSGFSALLAGYRLDYDGSFRDFSYNTYFWSSTEYNADDAFAMYLYYGNSGIGLSNYYLKETGFSVRCIKD